MMTPKTRTLWCDRIGFNARHEFNRQEKEQTFKFMRQCNVIWNVLEIEFEIGCTGQIALIAGAKKHQDWQQTQVENH